MMQNSTIKLVLRNKIKAWLRSLPDDVRKAVEPHIIVTGGAISSMLLGEKVNDYDVYLRTGEAAEVLALHYVKEFKRNPSRNFKNAEISVRREDCRVKIFIRSAGAASESENVESYDYFEGVDPESGEQSEYLDSLIKTLREEADSSAEDGKGSRYRPKFLTGNAITLSDDIQIVVRFFGEPKEIHKNYDFVHCTCSYDFGENLLDLPPKALTSLLDRRLKYVGSKYPLCSMIRVRKFIQRGWKISAGQLLKIAMQISELDMEKLDVLEEQLTGVDCAYFQQIIEALRNKDSDRVDKTYLASLIDRIA